MKQAEQEREKGGESIKDNKLMILYKIINCIYISDTDVIVATTAPANTTSIIIVIIIVAILVQVFVRSLVVVVVVVIIIAKILLLPAAVARILKCWPNTPFSNTQYNI